MLYPKLRSKRERGLYLIKKLPFSFHKFIPAPTHKTESLSCGLYRYRKGLRHWQSTLAPHSYTTTTLVTGAMRLAKTAKTAAATLAPAAFLALAFFLVFHLST